MAFSWAAGSSPPAAAAPSPAAARPARPATRTMKNSSRLAEKIARNLSRSSSGNRRVLGQGQHPGVEVEPRQLAVEQLRPVGLDRGGDRPVAGIGSGAFLAPFFGTPSG